MAYTYDRSKCLDDVAADRLMDTIAAYKARGHGKDSLLNGVDTFWSMVPAAKPVDISKEQGD